MALDLFQPVIERLEREAAQFRSQADQKLALAAELRK
jgi:hypothetical protein